MTRVLVAAALVLAALPSAAHGAFPPPSLSLQSSFSPPTGISRTDLTDQVTSSATAIAVDEDRIYTVGASGSGNSADIGIVAHLDRGGLDPEFSGDGKLTTSMATGTFEERAVDMVVLPDHRLRVLVLTVSGVGNVRDTGILGLLPDGAVDPDFGGGDGIVKLEARTPNTPAALALAPDGRLAITGSTGASGNDDVLVAVRNADGTPAAFGADPSGSIVLNRGGGTVPDGGVDVEWRPGGGLVILGQSGLSGATAAFLHAYTDAGADDAAFGGGDGDVDVVAGDAPNVPTAMLLHGGRLWMTGSTRSGVDTNAFVARTGLDGGDLQSRQFDMRGQLIDPELAVTSQAEGLAVLEGVPNTLLVGGSVASAGGTDWAVAAFNDIEGDLAAAGFGDIAISIPGSGGVQAVAVSSGGLAVSGPYQETVTTPSSSVTYTRTGTARVLVDAEKKCNLELTVTRPLELVLAPGTPASLDMTVSNRGARACEGAITAPDPYGLAYGQGLGPIPTGTLEPGSSFTAAGAALGYAGPLQPSSTVRLQVASAGDADTADNAVKRAVRFAYCDLDLTVAGNPAFMPSEGTRRFPLTVDNKGTETCERVRIGVGGQGRAGTRGARYSVRAGRDVADNPAAALRRRARPGDKVRIVFRARGTADANAANDRATVTPVVLGVGDSRLRRPRGAARVLRGTATPGSGPASKRRLRVTRVDVAVRRVGGGCRWLRSARSRSFRTVSKDSSKGCARPVWLRARGTSRWRLRTRGLPPGDYVVLSRVRIGAGFSEASFSAADGNEIAFRVAG